MNTVGTHTSGAASALGEQSPGGVQQARIEWEHSWSSSVDEAFSRLPYDHLMDPVLVRRLWETGVGRDRQKIAVVRAESGKPVGVVPLRKRGKLSWQMLTHYVMPYARFFVLPEYTDFALGALSRELDCSNVLFTRLPSRVRMLRAEESWVTALEPTYEALMKRTKYAAKDRQCRQRSGTLTLREDSFMDLPEVLDCWQRKWMRAGSRATAGRKDDLLLGYGVLAEQGRLKTFSLHDGDTLAAMEIIMVAAGTMYAVLTIMRPEYRQCHPGIRAMLAALEWGCGNGMKEYDMLSNFGHYKKHLAEPEVRGFRVVRSPFGSEALGSMIESTKDWVWRMRHKETS